MNKHAYRTDTCCSLLFVIHRKAYDQKDEDHHLMRRDQVDTIDARLVVGKKKGRPKALQEKHRTLASVNNKVKTIVYGNDILM